MEVWRQLKSNVTVIGKSGDNGASLVEMYPYSRNIAHEKLLREATCFAGYVRDGAAGRGKRVGVDEVSK